MQVVPTSQTAWEPLAPVDPLGQLLDHYPHSKMQQVQEVLHAALTFPNNHSIPTQMESKISPFRGRDDHKRRATAPAPESCCYYPPRLGVSQNGTIKNCASSSGKDDGR
jgi:hypothetical protein